MTQEEKSIFKRAIKVWGKMEQLYQTLEELAELETEIHQIRRNRNKDLVNIAGEVADVSIMLDQIKTMFGPDFEEVVDIVREKKIIRLTGRIEIAESRAKP